MATLKQQHAEFIERIKANGGRTATHKMPCCGAEVEDRLAPRGEKWDTLSTCPECGAMYWKVTTSSKVIGTIPEGV